MSPVGVSSKKLKITHRDSFLPTCSSKKSLPRGLLLWRPLLAPGPLLACLHSAVAGEGAGVETDPMAARAGAVPVMGPPLHLRQGRPWAPCSCVTRKERKERKWSC